MIIKAIFMKQLKMVLILLMSLATVSVTKAQLKQTSINSPDGHIKLSLLIKDGQLNYNIRSSDKTVIETSSLGLTIGDKKIGNASGLGTIKKRIINETYAWRGVHSTAVDHCVSAQFLVNSIAGSSFTLEARVYNDGVAFRYLVQETGNSEIKADLTGFTIPAGSTTWSQNDIGGYEGKYQQQTIEEVKEGQLVGPPITIKLPGTTGYVAITEGGVTNFAGMSLKADGSRGFKANLTGNTLLSGNIETPWRIVEIGKDLNTLVNCDIIANVSSKPDKTLFPQGFATPWIKPGKSAWSWLTDTRSVTLGNMKKFSKLAGELGIEYNLVDEGWSKWQEGAKDKWALLKELVDYSNQQSVKVWVWKAYPESNGVPGLKDAKYRHEFFKQVKEAGVMGIKIDFFDHESQEVLDFYQEALKDAAGLHLMLDFHGANKPTGQSRTWPNEMSREGIRGLENGTSWPKHNATLVFTRFLAGHGDYTPLSFLDMVKGTTLTHQVATVAAFTSPFMCLAVDPAALLKSEVKTIVKDMPVVWDETKVLPQSKIGELAILARRNGKTWYITALNGETPESVKVNLRFLQKGVHRATTLSDVSNDPSKTNIKTTSYSNTDSITINMAAGGGFLAVIE